MISFGPDTFNTIIRGIKDETPDPSLRHIMATIRLSGYDADVFYKFKQHLIDKVCFPEADGKMQLDIRTITFITYIFTCYG